LSFELSFVIQGTFKVLIAGGQHFTISLLLSLVEITKVSALHGKSCYTSSCCAGGFSKRVCLQHL